MFIVIEKSAEIFGEWVKSHPYRAAMSFVSLFFATLSIGFTLDYFFIQILLKNELEVTSNSIGTEQNYVCDYSGLSEFGAAYHSRISRLQSRILEIDKSLESSLLVSSERKNLIRSTDVIKEEIKDERDEFTNLIESLRASCRPI